MSPDRRPEDERVLLVAPTPRDAEVTCSLLRERQCRASFVLISLELSAQIARGVGAVHADRPIVVRREHRAVLKALEQQPSWSDVPVVLLTQSHRDRHRRRPARSWRGLRNLTVLDRPTSTRSMISAVRAALRARQRQYELRDSDAGAGARPSRRCARPTNARTSSSPRWRTSCAIRWRRSATGSQIVLRARRRRRGDAAARARHDGAPGRPAGQADRRPARRRRASRRARCELQREPRRPATVHRSALEGAEPILDAARPHADVTHCRRTGVGRRRSDAAGAGVRNLLHNAAKYTDPRRARAPERRAADAATRCVRVSDNGIGIPPDMLAAGLRAVHAGRPLARALAGRPGHRAVAGAPLVELHGGSVERRQRGPGHGQRRSPCACRCSGRRSRRRRGAPRPRATRSRTAEARAGRRRQRRRRRQRWRCC